MLCRPGQPGTVLRPCASEQLSCPFCCCSSRRTRRCLLSILDRLCFLGGKLLGSLRVGGIALLAPLLDDFGLLFLLCVGTVARVVAYGRAGDTSAGLLYEVIRNERPCAYSRISLHTSLEARSGNWLSNCALSAESPPPSKSSEVSARAADSLPVVNWVASSPRRARSRARKSSADGEPTSLIAVWAAHTTCD